MNNTRRTAIAKLNSQLEDIKSQVESLLSDEQDAYDNMPESFQDGERGEAAQSAISNLEDAVSSLEDAFNSLEESAQ